MSEFVFFIAGAVVGLVGGYFFFKNNPVIETKVDEVVDKIETEIKSKPAKVKK